MTKTCKRMVALVLVLCCLFACIPAAFAASASTAGNKTANVYLVTSGDKVLRRTTTVTISNTSSLSPIKITIAYTGCSVSATQMTIYPGSTKTFKIYTYLGKVGQVTVSARSMIATSFSLSVTANDNSFCCLYYT